MFKIVLILLSLSLSLFSKTTITVTYPVQQYFIEKIAIDKVYIRTVNEKMLKFKKDNKGLVYKLASSRYYFTFNLDEEKDLSNLFLEYNNDIETFDMSMNIKKMITNGHENPYIWMDPLLVRKIAKNIYEKLCIVQKDDKEFFTVNYEKFLKELDDLYLYLREDILNSELFGFLAYDDYWDYLASRFRLKVYKNEYRFLKIREVPGFIRFARKHDLRKIVIKKSNSYEVAQSLAGHIDAKIVEHDVFSHEWKSNIYMLVRKLVSRI